MGNNAHKLVTLEIVAFLRSAARRSLLDQSGSKRSRSELKGKGDDLNENCGSRMVKFVRTIFAYPPSDSIDRCNRTGPSSQGCNGYADIVAI